MSYLTEKSSDILDLSGTRCPMNFIMTKIKLDKIKTGELLEIILDEGDPIKNVPLSVEAEGHEVLRTKRLTNGTYSVLVRRA
ncbi:MAG: sulfurtransferase TusA family protein [Nitrospirae bacterium]|nr:sulfurtransferase TusA family protein [Nitrospirota bacterium]